MILTQRLCPGIKAALGTVRYAYQNSKESRQNTADSDLPCYYCSLTVRTPHECG